MLTNIKAIIFDFDDTLIQTFTIRSKAHIEAGRRFYNLDLTIDDVKAAWGLPFREMVRKLYGDVDDPDTIIAKYLTVSKEYPTKPQPDLLETLSSLKNRSLMGIISSASKELIQSSFTTHSIPSDIFFAIQTSEDTLFHKPDPRVFEPSLKYLTDQHITNTQTLYVGDSLDDFHAAKGADLHFIGVTTGQVSAEEFTDAGAQSIPALKEIVMLLK